MSSDFGISGTKYAHDQTQMGKLASKLDRLQGQLASTVTPGSHPHPRRVMKEANRLPDYLTSPDVDEVIERASNYAKTQKKPSNKRRRKSKDRPLSAGGNTPEAGSSRSAIDEASGTADTGRGLHSGQQEEVGEVDQIIAEAAKMARSAEIVVAIKNDNAFFGGHSGPLTLGIIEGRPGHYEADPLDDPILKYRKR